MAFNEYPYTNFHEMNLDWVIKKVKELAAAWAQVQQDWTDEQAAFANLQSWIENYFNNLDVQTEINVKLDAMVVAGTMSELIAPYVASGLPAEVAAQIGDVVAAQIGPVVAAQIGAVVADQLPSVAAAAAAQEVSAWLALHVDPDTGYVIDDTFTVQGAAADAKAVGDEFTSIKSALSDEIKLIRERNIEYTLDWTNKKYINRSGTAVTAANTRFNATLDFMPIYKGATLDINVYAAGEADNVVIYELDKSTVREYLNPTAETTYSVTADGFIRLSNDTNYLALADTFIKMSYAPNIPTIEDDIDATNDRIDDLYVEGETKYTTSWQAGKYIQTTGDTPGSIGNSTTIACTIDAQRFPKNKCKLTVKNGYKCSVFRYDTTSGISGFTPIYDYSHEKTGSFEYTFNHYKYYRFCVRKLDGSAMDSVPSDVLTYNEISIGGEKTVTVHSGESILEGVMEAYSVGAEKVIVESGTYDIIDEYEDHFGATYFSDYEDAYNHQQNRQWDFGLWLDDIEIVFSAGAKVTANYTGNNQYVKKFFSAFACGNDVTIDGLVLDCTELRYGIHPDFRDNRDINNFVVRNCDLRCYRPSDSTIDNNSAIGAGLPMHGNWLFENCVIRSDTSNRVIRIHNNVASGAESLVVIKNCYIDGNGHIEINSYGESTDKTKALVCGCSWVNPVQSNLDAPQSYQTVNIDLLAFANETRV